MVKLLLVATLFFVGLLAGCTSVSEIRTHHGSGTDVPRFDPYKPGADCNASSSTPLARANSIEDFTDYWAGYVEFDDEGWLYESRGRPNQMQVLQSRLKHELDAPRFAGTDFLIVAFVHGWHHNAHDNDCNVHEFRATLQLVNERIARAAAEATRMNPSLKPRPVRVVGVYAGWRGESIDIDVLNVTTVLDRRNAAERVAKGDVRELFAQLRRLQVRESRKPEAPFGRMRTVVVGHSFGGLIAFHGLSPAILNELTLTKPEDDGHGCTQTLYRPPATLLPANPATASLKARQSDIPSNTVPVFPDMLVLINPAFEATRFETLHQLMMPKDGCPYEADRPKLVVVTADNDKATGPVFSTARRLLTLLEAYPDKESPEAVQRQRDANLHAIGFTDRYKTHRLCLAPSTGPNRRAVAALIPTAESEWKPDPYAPIWVVGAPEEIVDGHNGFLFASPPKEAVLAPASTDPAEAKRQEPLLLNWLVDLSLYGPGPESSAMAPDGTCSPLQ